jgi:hypothetical protein
MKLISLNTWGGVAYEPLMDFIKTHSTDTDIFCFQEVFPCSTTPLPALGKVRPNLFWDIKNILTDFNSYHAISQEKAAGGLAIFIKKYLIVDKIDHIVIFEPNNIEDEYNDNYFYMGRDLQQIEFSNADKNYTILNFHGMWTIKGKDDDNHRILQSEKIKKIFDEAKGSRILCGDFNLKPDTKSIAILSENNRNLIQDYKVTSTRSSLYTKSIKFADYMIVSPEVEVKDFKVLKNEVSDHLPLSLNFS